MILSKEKEDAIIAKARAEYPIDTQMYYMDSYGEIDYLDPVVITREPEASCRQSDDFFVDGGRGYIYVNGYWNHTIGRGKQVPVEPTKDNYLTIS